MGMLHREPDAFYLMGPALVAGMLRHAQTKANLLICLWPCASTFIAEMLCDFTSFGTVCLQDLLRTGAQPLQSAAACVISSQSAGLQDVRHQAVRYGLDVECQHYWSSRPCNASRPSWSCIR